ncbi:MAG: hypothetical protein K2W99_00715 [Chthoniobacterales bacterium]|nr:hypothetical protein [Chthoniobacterales bacterium]
MEIVKKPEVVETQAALSSRNRGWTEDLTTQEIQNQEKQRGSLAGHGIAEERKLPSRNDIKTIGNSVEAFKEWEKGFQQWPAAPTRRLNFNNTTLLEEKLPPITAKVELEANNNNPITSSSREVLNEQQHQLWPSTHLNILTSPSSTHEQSSPVNPQFLSDREASLRMSDVALRAAITTEATTPHPSNHVEILAYPSLPDLKTWTRPQQLDLTLEEALPQAYAPKIAPAPQRVFINPCEALAKDLIPIKAKIRKIDQRQTDYPKKTPYSEIVTELEKQFQNPAFSSKVDEASVNHISRLLRQADDWLLKAAQQQGGNGFLENAARAILRATARIAQIAPANCSNIKEDKSNSAIASQEAAHYFLLADTRNSEFSQKFGRFQQEIFHHLAELLAYKANLLNVRAELSAALLTPSLLNQRANLIKQSRQAEKDIKITHEAILDFQKINTATNRMSADCLSKMGALRRKVRDEHHKEGFNDKTNAALQAISHFEQAVSLFEKYGESYVQAQCYYELGLLSEMIHGVETKLPPPTLASLKKEAQQIQNILTAIEQKNITANFTLSKRDQYFDALRKTTELCNIILNEQCALAEAKKGRDVLTQNKIDFFVKCDTTALQYLKKAFLADNESEFNRLKEIGFSCCNEDFLTPTEEIPSTDFLLKKTTERLRNAIQTNDQELLNLGIFSYDSLQLFHNAQPLHEQQLKIANFFKSYAQELLNAKISKNTTIEDKLLEFRQHLPRSINDELFLPQAKLLLYQASLALTAEDPLSSTVFLNIAQQLDSSIADSSHLISVNNNISTVIRLHTLALPLLQQMKDPELIHHFCNLLETPLADYRDELNYCPSQVNMLFQQSSTFLQRSMSGNDPAPFQTGKAFFEVGKTLQDNFRYYEIPSLQENHFWHSIASLYHTGTPLDAPNQAIAYFLKSNIDRPKVDTLNQCSLAVLRNLLIQPETQKLEALLLLQQTSREAAAKIKYAPESQPLCDLLTCVLSSETKIDSSSAPDPSTLKEAHLMSCYQEAARFFQQGVEQQDPLLFQAGLSLLEFAEQKIEDHLPTLENSSTPDRLYWKNLMDLYKRYGDVDEAIFIAEKKGNRNQLEALKKEQTYLERALRANHQIVDPNKMASQEENADLFREVKENTAIANSYRDQAQKYLMGEK